MQAQRQLLPGIARGAIVLLVIDAAREEIIDAEAMVGSTVFARFRPRPGLRGPLVTAEFRERNRFVQRATSEASDSFRTIRAGATRRIALRGRPGSAAA